MDECSIVNNVVCDNVTESCINTVGSFLCECKGGFQLSKTVIWGKVVTGGCVDVNECSQDPCNEHSSCNNTFGGYDCVCYNGYEHINDTVECGDVDECATNSCGGNGVCVNTDGSYQCNCNSGFSFENDTCADIDECALDLCPANSICVNTIGDYNCDCVDGYEPHTVRMNKFVNFTSCIDTDECVGDNECDEFATCANTDGSYDCLCDNGFGHTNISEPFSCYDLDECALQNTCGIFGSCNNTIGSYACLCDHGYEDVNRTCIDIDECSNNDLNDCAMGSGAICTNDSPEYTCSCPNGHHGNGTVGDHCILLLECNENEFFDLCGNAICFDSCNGPQCPSPNGTYDYSDCHGGCRCAEGFVKMESAADSPCILDTQCDMECEFYEEETHCGNRECYDTCDTLLDGLPQICPNATQCLLGCTCPEGYVRADDHWSSTCITTGRCNETHTAPVRHPFLWQMKEHQIPAGVDISDNTTWGIFADTFAPSRVLKHNVPGLLLSGELVFAQGFQGDGGVFNGEYYMSFKLVLETDLDVLRYPPEYILTILEQHTTTILSPAKNPDFFNLVDDININIPCHLEECYPDCGEGMVYDPCESQNCFDTCETIAYGTSQVCNNDTECVGSCVCDIAEGMVAMSDNDETCMDNSMCKEELAQCLPDVETYDECVGTTCFHSCNTYVNKLDAICPANGTECSFGCGCNEGYVKVDDDIQSACILKENCTIPECPVNEVFDMCQNNCYRSCDTENPVCTDDCAATCNCIDGYVRESDDPDAECIPEGDCKFIVDLTCGADAHLVDCLDPCFDICENTRLERNRTECTPLGPTDTCYAGCVCNAGFVRLNGDQFSPCVATADCSTTYTTKEKFDFYQLVAEEDFPLKINVNNSRTWNALTIPYKDFDTGPFLYVLGLEYMEKIFVGIEGGGWQYKMIYAVQFQYVDDRVMGNMYDFIDDAWDTLAISQSDFIMQWDRDFESFTEENDFYFPCYSRECDEQFMDCDRQTEFIGCPDQIGPTCQDAHAEIMTGLLATWLELISQSSRSTCADKDRQCVCKPGYYRVDNDLKSKCVSYDKCFGGCPRHSYFTPNMPWCMGHCTDPEGNQCRADANAVISNFDQVKDQLDIPGCLCLPSYVKESSEPFSDCLPEEQCVVEDPECPSNSHWEWEAPSCFQSCKHISPWDPEDPCLAKKAAYCACDEGYYKQKPYKKAKCVQIEKCFEDICKKGEEFDACMPQCFHDCTTLMYDEPELCYDWEDPGECHMGCVCEDGYVRKNGFLQIHGFKKSKCVKTQKCKKPKTQSVNFVEQTPTLPDEVDPTDSDTWTALAEKYELDGVEIVDIIEVPSTSSLNLHTVGRYLQARYHVPMKAQL